MSSFIKVVVASITGVVLLAATLVQVSPIPIPHAYARAAAATNLPYSATANGPYSVSGNKIMDANGQQYIFHGIGRDGLEYNCSGEGPLDQQHLAYMGSGVNTPTATYWGANTVRLPLSEGFWLKGAPGYPCTAAQYHATVKQVVDTLTALKLNVILDLHWTDADGQSGQGGGPWAMPDADSIAFWQQVAPIYSSYSNVLFEVANEPHPSSWSCWKDGCPITNDSEYSDDCQCAKTFTYSGVGMQALVTAVRNTGANNLILVGGMVWGYDLSQLDTYKLSGANIVYDTHPYPYAGKQPSTWDNAFGNPSATYPVISAENGEYDCDSTYMAQLLSYFDAHQIGWVGWAWATRGSVCTYPSLVTDYNGTPAAGTGLYIYQHLRRYAPTSAPVNTVWYFAEGRVGASFTEYLTLDNPDPINDCPVTIQYLPETGSPVTRTITVAHTARWTELVNKDLGIPSTRTTGLSVSTIVTVNPSSSCRGVVAERPMYFSWNGIRSGSDALGATHLGQSFYFADIPTSGGFTSFLTALNPPNSEAATVTSTYYVGGKSVGNKSISLQPGQRGTLFPSSSGLPAHVTAVVTSTQPIVAERPDYFSNVSAGNAGTVSGASSVVGVQALSHDWLFAEGYTGGKFQEYLVIANLDTTNNTTANVTIKLQLGDGSTKTFALPVKTLDQVSWNVNQNIAANTVSAEVTSSNAAVVVEREMFFQYINTIPGRNGFSVAAAGGTDVMGQVGPATVNSYSFSEGYSNVGYNEWLSLQNPTNTDETINLTLVNGYGRTYSPAAVMVKAHSRSTVDVSSLVRQYLIQAGGNDPTISCAVSVSMQAAPGVFFVAERPMYWNTGTGGTQGGSDVIGYAGA